MTKLKVKDIRQMNAKDMTARIQDLKKEHIKLRAQVATGTVPKKPSEIRNIRRNIARILTIQKEKEEPKTNE